MAIGLNPPSIFMKTKNLAPKKKELRDLDILPSPIWFICLESDFRKKRPALSFALLTRSLKIGGTILSGPAADPFAKDFIAFYR